MNISPSFSYKGFDIYTLVYKTDAPREWHERRPDRTYTASVVICEEGSDPAAQTARVFPLPADQWDSFGSATRAAVLGGQAIIDGFVPGEGMSGGRNRPAQPA